MTPDPGALPSAAATGSSAECPTCQELKDEEASVLAELEAAIAADPSLKAENPKSAGAQWEDYEDAIAKNPDFAAPVATNREKKYYSLKEKWECGHEGKPYVTAIERDGGVDDKDALLVSDIKGICPACMAKWNKLEQRDEGSAGGSGLPAYSESWNDHGKNRTTTITNTTTTKTFGELSDDDEPASSRRFGRETNLTEHDEGPSKGKGTANTPAGGTFNTPNDRDRSASPDPYSDDDDSIVGSDTLLDTPIKPKKQVRFYDSDESSDDNTGKGKSKAQKGSGPNYESEDDDYSDDGSFSGSDSKEDIKKKRLSFFKLGKKQ